MELITLVCLCLDSHESFQLLCVNTLIDLDHFYGTALGLTLKYLKTDKYFVLHSKQPEHLRICWPFGMDCDDKENWILSEIVAIKMKQRIIMSILVRFKTISDQIATELLILIVHIIFV